jgi:hypothetical protein
MLRLYEGRERQSVKPLSFPEGSLAHLRDSAMSNVVMLAKGAVVHEPFATQLAQPRRGNDRWRERLRSLLNEMDLILVVHLLRRHVHRLLPGLHQHISALIMAIAPPHPRAPNALAFLQSFQVAEPGDDNNHPAARQPDQQIHEQQIITGKESVETLYNGFTIDPRRSLVDHQDLKPRHFCFPGHADGTVKSRRQGLCTRELASRQRCCKRSFRRCMTPP